MTNKSTAAFSSHMVGRHIVRPNGERAYIVAALSTGRRVDGCSEYAAIWASRPYSTTEALESGDEPECQNGMFPFWTGYYTDGASFWSAGEYGHSGLSIDTAMARIISQGDPYLFPRALHTIQRERVAELAPEQRDAIAAELEVPDGTLDAGNFERYERIYDGQRARRHGLAVKDVTAERHRSLLEERSLLERANVANALANAVTPIMVDVPTSLATGKLVAELPELPA